MKALDRILIIVIVASLIVTLTGSLFLFHKSQGVEVNAEERTTIKVDNGIRNLGTIKRGDAISACFEICNTGDRDLIIDAVHPDCTCTQFFMGDEIVPPGGKTTIVLNIDTLNKLGEQEINAVVSANIPERHFLLRIKFDVDGYTPFKGDDIHFAADTIYVGKVKKNNQLSIRQFVRNDTKTDINIVSTYTDCSCLSFPRPASILHSGESLQLDLTLNNNVHGPFSKKARLGFVLDESVHYISFVVTGETVD